MQAQQKVSELYVIFLEGIKAINKENYEIRKWGHKKSIEKGDIILIPPYWSYIQEIEKGIIQYHMDIDTYFTFIPNYFKDN